MLIRLLLLILCYLDAGEGLGLDVHVVDPLGHEGDRRAVLVVGLEGLKQGVITSRGAKRRRLLHNWNRLLTFLALGIARAHISWFKKEGWKTFCIFVIVCFILSYELHEQTNNLF